MVMSLSTNSSNSPRSVGVSSLYVEHVSGYPEEILMEELAQPVLGVFPEPAKISRPLWFKKRLLILGTGQLARDLSMALQFQRRFLVDIVGYLDGKGEERL